MFTASQLRCQSGPADSAVSIGGGHRRCVLYLRLHKVAANPVCLDAGFRRAGLPIGGYLCFQVPEFQNVISTESSPAVRSQDSRNLTW